MLSKTVAHFRVRLNAASLKRSLATDQRHRRVAFPRSIERGLIEATFDQVKGVASPYFRVRLNAASLKQPEA